jgi:hypothetical protein
MKFITTALLSLLTATNVKAQCSSQPSSLTCTYTATAPTLDADLSDWVAVTGIETKIYQIGGTVEYLGGSVSYKCSYDDSNIYFALAIPGDYRFDTTTSELCASIATMLKVGSLATFVNMGGCPDAASGCSSSVAPASCDNYRVDLGAHWELPSTQQSVAYTINAGTGTGEDLVASLNDEYAVSAYCRAFDDGAGAGNEWAGAWAHSNPIDGEAGTYTFELSRLLTTGSSSTDAQLVAGGTYQFGIAFWDPYESAAGWSDPGHYVTGCAAEWIDLVLEASSSSGSTSPAATETPVGSPTASVAPIAAPVLAVPRTTAPVSTGKPTTTAPSKSGAPTANVMMAPLVFIGAIIAFIY